MFDYDPPEEDEKRPTDYSGLIIGLILLPVFFYLVYLSNADTALAACVVLGMIMVAVRLRWYLRRHLWFWAVIVLILALHAPLIFIVKRPLGNVPTLVYTMPVGIADLVIILWAVDTAEGLFSKGSPPDDENE